MDINNLTPMQLTGLLQMQGAVGGAGQTRPGLQEGTQLFGLLQQQQQAVANQQRAQEEAERKGLLFQQGQRDRSTQLAATAAAKDPTSAISKQAQATAKRLYPDRDFSTMSAAELAEFIPDLAAVMKQQGIDERADSLETWRQKQYEKDEQRYAAEQQAKNRAAILDRANTIRRANPTMSKAQAEARAAMELGIPTGDVSAESALTEAASASAAGLLPQQPPVEAKPVTAEETAGARARTAVETGLTEGQKSADKKYATDYNEWTATGRSQAQKSLNQLLEAERELETIASEGDGLFGLTSGRFVGEMPDILRSEQSRALQQKVQASALAGIRAAMGAAFTEKEGDRVLGMAYDPKLSPSENLKKVKETLAELRQRITSAEITAKHYGNYGTTVGVEELMPRIDVGGTSTNWEDM